LQIVKFEKNIYIQYTNMGKGFKLKPQNNLKKIKKAEEELKPLRSPYVKEKPTKIYPVFFDFYDEYEPPKVKFDMNKDSQW